MVFFLPLPSPLTPARTPSRDGAGSGLRSKFCSELWMPAWRACKSSACVRRLLVDASTERQVLLFCLRKYWLLFASSMGSLYSSFPASFENMWVLNKRI